MEEKEQKWIFIEKSSETVRFKKKAGDSDSSMDDNCNDDDDFEYLPPNTNNNPGNRSPTSDTYEFIPSKSDRRRTAGGSSRDEIEIHDNHFSSCPTSEMEDSDIEVVIKSPSSSETASLCSFNSQKSGDNNDTSLLLPYDDLLFTSQKSVVTDAATPTTQPSDRLLFNLNMSDNLPTSDSVSASVCRDNEEEDSEVEVISRSIHRNGSIEVSFVADLLNNHELGLMHESVSSGSENEHEDEPEIETTFTSKFITPLLAQEKADEEEEAKMVDEQRENESEEQKQTDEERDDEEEEVEEEEEQNGVEEIQNNETESEEEEHEEGEVVYDDDNSPDDSIDDIKCFLQDFCLSKQLNSRLVGLKTSTLALTVCLSITLGVYMGNYISPSSTGHFDDMFLVPDDVLSINDDPPRVNITFKYSPSTRDTLQSMVTSFKKLKDDYDRLRIAYEEMKERFARKQQMSLYWRKHAQKPDESDEKADKRVKNMTRRNIHKIFRKSYLSSLQNGTLAATPATYCSVKNRTLIAQEKTISKLTRDLMHQRKSTKYWKKRFQDIESSRINTCSRYDDPITDSFSFKDCFNIFSNVIPSLDISAINITNRAEDLAGQVQNAWSRLVNSARWNPRKFVKKSNAEGSVNSHKVKRFRRIFVISNVVSSAHAHHSKHRIHSRNNTKGSKTDDVMFLREDNGENDCDYDDGEVGIIMSSATLHFGDTCNADCNKTCNCDTKNSGDNNNNDSGDNDNNNSGDNDNNNDENNKQQADNKGDNSTKNNENDVKDNIDNSLNNNNTAEDESGESDWYRARYHQSQFLLNAYKYVYEHQSETLKTRHTSELKLAREEHIKRTIELKTLERENMILQEKLKHRDARIENAKDKLKELLNAEMTRCNSTISSVKDAMEANCKTVLDNVEFNLKQVERSRYKSLLKSERKKYEALIRNVKRVVRRVEKSKSKKKLRELKKKLESEQKGRYVKVKNEQKKKNKKDTKNKFQINHKKKGEKKRRKNNYKHHDDYKKQEKNHKKNYNKNKKEGNMKKKLEDKSDHKFKIHSHDYSKYDPFTKEGRQNFENNKEIKSSVNKKQSKRFNMYSTESKDYARKYKESKREVIELKKIYEEALKQSQFQEELITGYRRQMENYRKTILDYEAKMKEVKDREEQQKEELFELTEQMKQFEDENTKLKQSLNNENPFNLAEELNKRTNEEENELKNSDTTKSFFNEIPKKILIYTNPTNKDEIITVKEFENISYVTTENQKTSAISVSTVINGYHKLDLFNERKADDTKKPDVEEKQQQKMEAEKEEEDSGLSFLKTEPKRVIMYNSPLNKDELVTIRMYENISCVSRENKVTSAISVYTIPKDYDFTTSYFEGRDRLVLEKEDEKKQLFKMPSLNGQPKQITMYENPYDKDEIITVKDYEELSYATKTSSNYPGISIYSLPKHYDFETIVRIVNKRDGFKGNPEMYKVDNAAEDNAGSVNDADEDHESVNDAHKDSDFGHVAREDAEDVSIPEKKIDGDEEEVTVRDYHEFTFVLKREKYSELSKPVPDISFPEDFLPKNNPDMKNIFEESELNPSIPPSEEKTKTPLPPSEEKPLPPSEEKSETPLPPSEEKSETPLPPSEEQSETPLPPSEEKSETPLPPSEEQSETPLPPSEENSEAPLPPSERKSSYRESTLSYINPANHSERITYKEYEDAAFTMTEPLHPNGFEEKPKWKQVEKISDRIKARELRQKKALKETENFETPESFTEKKSEDDGVKDEPITVSSSYLDLPCIETENTTSNDNPDLRKKPYIRISIGKPSRNAFISISGKFGEYEIIKYSKADGTINDKSDEEYELEKQNDVTNSLDDVTDNELNASSAFNYEESEPSIANVDCHGSNEDNKDGKPFYNIEDVYPADLFRRYENDEGDMLFPTPGKPIPPPSLFSAKKNALFVKKEIPERALTLPPAPIPPAPIPPTRVQERQNSDQTDDDSSFVVPVTDLYEDDEDSSSWPSFAPESHLESEKEEPILIRSADEDFLKILDDAEDHVERAFISSFKPETHSDDYRGSDFSPEHHEDGDEESESVSSENDESAPTFAPGPDTKFVSLLGDDPRDERDMGPSFAPEPAKKKENKPVKGLQFFMDGPSFRLIEDDDFGPSVVPDAPKKSKGETGEDNWFLRSMRERHNLRVSKGTKHVDWLWRYMTEREKLRTAREAFHDANWFLKAMKEREEIRKKKEEEDEDNWFVKAMRERENLRDSHDDDED